MKYSIEEQIEAVERWQKCDFVHPLTCRNDSKLLVPKHINAEDVYGEYTQEEDWVVLSCPDCDYIQSFIPKYIFTLTYFKIKKLEKIYNRLNKEE